MRSLGVDLQLLGLDLSRSGESAPLVPGLPGEAFRHERQPLPLRALNAAFFSYHQWPYCGALAGRVDELVAQWRPDVVHAEELRMAAYLPALRGKKCKARQTVTFHNVESDLILRTGSSSLGFAKAFVEPMHRLNLERFESRVIQRLDLCLAYSEVDMTKYQRKFPGGRWRATRGGASASAESRAPEVEEPSALIAGSLGYAPNVEGIEWFLEKVLRHARQGIRFTVAGSNASPALREKIAAASFVFVDTPADLAPLYASHSLSLVPLLNGSGTRGRILESLGHGRAVVATTIGAEGLELAEGDGLVRADDPLAFAEALNRLTANHEERRRMAEKGFARVREKFDWRVVATDLAKIWEHLP
jgi:glycosyltransferase involved in cell wall biosynthesis